MSRSTGSTRPGWSHDALRALRMRRYSPGPTTAAHPTRRAPPIPMAICPIGIPPLSATGSACSVFSWGAGLGECAIAGKSPEAVPASAVKPAGRVPVIPPGRAELPEPAAAAAAVLVVEVDETLCEEDGAEEAGEEAREVDGAVEGAGELATVGLATAMLAAALGGVHGTSVGTTAVAVSVSAEPDVPAGTWARSWSLDGEPRSPMEAIQQWDVLAPTMQLVVKVGVPAEDASMDTVTSSAVPLVTETSTT